MVIGGDRGDLGVGHGDLRVERGQLQMLLVLLRAVVSARKREDQWVIALQLAEPSRCARVIRQLVVGEGASGHDIRTHDATPVLVPAYLGESFRFSFVTELQERFNLRVLSPS